MHRHQSPVRAIRLRPRFRVFRVKPPQGQSPPTIIKSPESGWIDRRQANGSEATQPSEYNRRGDRPHSHPFSTLKAPKRRRARNRASGAIDGGAPTPDCKPSGLNRRRLATVTLRVFRSRRRHGNSPFGRKTRSGMRFNPSVFFARRANFRVAGEAESRRLMLVRVTAVERLSSVALA